MKENYLLIDFENVQPRSLALLSGRPFKVIVFHGANQTKVSLELAKSLQPLGNNVRYIAISGNGRNALDFHIAFTLGELSRENPGGTYHIISRDTGFDPLISYLKARGLHVQRSKEVADIPLLRIARGTRIPEKVDAIVGNLVVRGPGRPRKVRTLKNTINALFSKSLNDSELAEIIRILAAKRYITIENDNVTYQLPSMP